MKYILLVLIILTGPFISVAQYVKGKVVSATKAPLHGATVIWLNNKKGTVTNEAGEFKIELPKRSPQPLLVSFVGYKTDTLTISDTTFMEITLSVKSTLDDVTIGTRRKASYIASTAIKTEVISSLN